MTNDKWLRFTQPSDWTIELKYCRKCNKISPQIAKTCPSCGTLFPTRQTKPWDNIAALLDQCKNLPKIESALTEYELERIRQKTAITNLEKQINTIMDEYQRILANYQGGAKILKRFRDENFDLTWIYDELLG